MTQRQTHPEIRPEQIVPLYRQGIEEFNRRRFFECHETLETVWREEWRRTIRPFYQGLIQLAVGFHHLSQRNFRGARNLLERGSKNLGDFRPRRYGVEVGDLLERVKACRDEILRLGPERLGAFPLHLIPTIELGDLDDLQADWAEA